MENTSLSQHVGFKYICKITEILRAVDYASHPLQCLFPLLHLRARKEIPTTFFILILIVPQNQGSKL